MDYGEKAHLQKAVLKVASLLGMSLFGYIREGGSFTYRRKGNLRMPEAAQRKSACPAQPAVERIQIVAHVARGTQTQTTVQRSSLGLLSTLFTTICSSL